MDGKDFLIAAKKFVRSQFEAELRSAISRAYYALFHTAARFLNEIISQCNKEPLRRQIRTNIREYERKINL